MDYKLETKDIRKVYPGTVALDGVSVRFEGGKVHALVGKNGAGKSTLIKLFAGAIQPTSGSILVDGREVHLRSPGDAFHQGIATVYQELSLLPELTVAENVLLGRLPRKRWLGGQIVDWPAANRQAARLLEAMQVRIDPRERAGRLPLAQQQIVEIAKAMSFEPKVLLLDEPTSALAQHETELLFDVIRKLAASGVAILYISHRLQELPRIADTVTVLRDGRLAGRIGIEEATPAALVHMMFGEIVRRERPLDLPVGDETVLEVRGLTRRGAFEDVSFSLQQGEVLGIAGTLGSGRTELLRALFGADSADAGEILVAGRPIRDPSPDRMKRAGVVLTPENRKEEGLVLVRSTRENLCLASLERIGRRGVTTAGRERAAAEKLVDALQIQAGSIERPVSLLSGGNQQKVIVGKWLNTQPRVMLLDEPTRGIDVQAKQQIFQTVWNLSRQGISSIFVSSELEELLEVCHRILVMRHGRAAESLPAAGLTLDRLFALCMEE